jgi:transposase
MQQDMATALFALEGVRVDWAETEPDGTVSVWVRTAAENAGRCPGCQMVSAKKKDRVVTCPVDVQQAGRRTRVYWLKDRWECRQPGCARKTFTESIGQVPSRHRLTGRLRQELAVAVADHGRSVASVAREHGCSWQVAHKAFIAYAQRILPQQPPAVRVLGIDETRRGRLQWERDADGTIRLIADRWHVGFVDVTGEQGMLGQVEGRTADDVSYWLAQAGPAWRCRVELVTIDMCTIFKSAVRRMLPHARICVDRFHLVQLASKCVHEVRRRVLRQLYGRRGKKGDTLWAIRNLLTANYENLGPAQFEKLWNTLIDADGGAQDLHVAWIAKEMLRDLLALTGTGPARSEIAGRLYTFLAWCADSGVPELSTLATSISNWREEIANTITYAVSNAKSEGLNRVLKLECRVAYGFRNAANQRLRIHCATTRTSRRRSQQVTQKRSHPVIIRPPDPG